MNYATRSLILTALVAGQLTLLPVVRAGVSATAIREISDQLLNKGGRDLAGETAEALGGRLATVAEKHGASGLEAVRRGGPTAFRYLVEGGEEGAKVVKLFEKYGDGAVHLVARPKSMTIFIKHGDEAAAAMIRHPGIAEDLITP